MTADRRRERQQAIRDVLARDGLDALLVTHLPNIRYLTGFTGSAGLLVVLPAAAVLVTDFRYSAQAPMEVGNSAGVEIDQSNVWNRLGRVLAAEGPAAVGVEASYLTLRDADRLKALGRFSIVPTTDLVERFRAAKAPAEVSAIIDAATLAQEALAEVLPTIRDGQREIDVAARLEAALRRRGSEWHPFQTIAASGPRAALPHARTTTRTIGRGEWLLLDFGAQVDGYCADLTRTVVVGGRADDRQRAVYDVVRRAQARAIAHVAAGMTGREADALAREPIAAAGFGEAFGHSLGHGLGLEVHEAPRLAPTSEAVLPLHAVVTVEPGVYLPGWGGVRIEDDVYLGPDGPRCLSDNRTDLIELP